MQILKRQPTYSDLFLKNVAAVEKIIEGSDSKEDLDSNEDSDSDELGSDLRKNVKAFWDLSEGLTEQNNGKEGHPPENFRELSLYPEKEDMTLVGKPYLRKNITKGRYNDGEHYLDVQFRLLREDFLGTLRSGVQSYRSALINGTRAEVYIYDHVKIFFPEFSEGTMFCYVTFAQRPNCRWIREMKYGSLVVLSRDCFEEDFLFAILADRDITMLRRGVVKLVFEDLSVVDYGAEYKMIESNAYFEAYLHVLNAMKAFPRDEDIPFHGYFVDVETRAADIPFHKYFVDVETRAAVPSYIAENGFKIDFGVICGDSDDRQVKMIDVRKAHKELTPDEVHLDDSQHKALVMAFQQELAVIQGPPGTGKTYLGHQISRVLLDNEKLWNRDRKHPMLVVCYTNHALDQFLNGILDFMLNDDEPKEKQQADMIRVGSQCKDQRLEKYNLKEIRKRQWVPPNLARLCWKAYEERQGVINRITSLSRSLKNLLENLADFASLDIELLHDMGIDGHPVSTSHKTQFSRYVRQDLQLNDVFIDWLTIPGHPLSDVFIDWLTIPGLPVQQKKSKEKVSRHTANGNATLKMDLLLIERLIDAGISEQLAKNLSYMCGNNFKKIMDYYDQSPPEKILELIHHSLPEIYA
uniref:AAA_11 domain-containing protein n=1 Tax=Steinernema glaseri TaxID=37863 RepID=A0A1I7YLX0_9BILA